MSPDDISSIEYGSLSYANEEFGVNHGGLKHEVMVEAEIMMGDERWGLGMRVVVGQGYPHGLPVGCFASRYSILLKAVVLPVPASPSSLMMLKL